AGRRKRQAGEDKEGRKARGKRQGSESPGSNGHEAGQPAASRDDAAGNEGRTGKSNSEKANPGKAGGTGRSTTKPRRGRNGEIRTVMRNGEPIGAHIADAYDRMAAAARQDGVTLRVNSGYRSHAEQVRLWNANPNPALVARPGTSNHESGSAIDFANVGRAWSWLKRNAQRFGFRNYPVEAWHYDYVGGKA
ncbi:MAG: D-alanyl-D-alanine carboxypeptidase family protein, partial [Candidatus Sericytochromatia bacterium]|nr:D-alanyl-D-alanine carboxypeptidase family protein [Candidatus Tanganyikabacteria bacterium]